MISNRLKNRLTWAIILAQVFVLVIGHGRVVLCHDDTGTSHIELVKSDSCSSVERNECSNVTESQHSSISPSCSGTTCEDELFLIQGMLAAKWDVHFDTDQVEHSYAAALQSPSLMRSDTAVVSANIDHVYLLIALHESIRSTVLVL
tara:strand:+ start:577048 stop:577488 length:441 start_codon:yes stop_codon:yes gene_type:complete